MSPFKNIEQNEAKPEELKYWPLPEFFQKEMVTLCVIIPKFM